MLSSCLLVAALAAAPSPSDIIVTASLEPVQAGSSAASVTVIDDRRIAALGLPLATDLLRLAPGVSVASSGGRGAQTQVRIRGAEANHTLLFIDGIAFNDVAAGNEARFETLAADGLGRIEIVRGPQSALFGSEALGGVIALETPDPTAGTRLDASGEYGSRDFARGAVSAVAGSERGGISASASYLRDDGIDTLGGGAGDRDGFENVTASLKAIGRPGENGEFGIVGRYIRADNSFDGTDPLTFRRADTADASRTETGAVRAWARYGINPDAPVTIQTEGQYLHSDNRNRRGTERLNATMGDRLRVAGQFVGRASGYELIARAEREDETFRASDAEFAGLTDQRRTRGRTAFVGEWRAAWSDHLSTDVAVRHDSFNRFADATTVRAGVVASLTEVLSLVASYGEGIAQPTFFDLYGFFPNSFAGNPNLTPERSRGYEAGIRFNRPAVALAVTAFDNRLRDEIVPTYDPATGISSTANATGRSKRRGIEVDGEVRPIAGLRLSANYTYLHARDQQVASAVQLRETRRPKHAANLIADYTAGPVIVGAGISYVGRRRDTDFDLFPAPVVHLNDYVLGSLRVAYRITPNVEAFGRVENLGDAQYQDVVGYATPGRSIHGGIRLRFD